MERTRVGISIHNPQVGRTIVGNHVRDLAVGPKTHKRPEADRVPDITNTFGLNGPLSLSVSRDLKPPCSPSFSKVSSHLCFILKHKGC